MIPKLKSHRVGCKGMPFTPIPTLSTGSIAKAITIEDALVFFIILTTRPVKLDTTSTSRFHWILISIVSKKIISSHKNQNASGSQHSGVSVWQTGDEQLKWWVVWFRCNLITYYVNTHAIYSTILYSIDRCMAGHLHQVCTIPVIGRWAQNWGLAAPCNFSLLVCSWAVEKVLVSTMCCGKGKTLASRGSSGFE